MTKPFLTISLAIFCVGSFGQKNKPLTNNIMQHPPQKITKIAAKPTKRSALIPELVLVSGGTFCLGENMDDTSIWQQKIPQVTVDSFLMGKYEVTVAQFAAFVKATKYVTDCEKRGKGFVFGKTYLPVANINWKSDELGKKQTNDNKPVTRVSWNDAQAYCEWLCNQDGRIYRLPTKAEWEFAAGNGINHTKYSWGNDEPKGRKKLGNIADESINIGGAWHNNYFGYYDGYMFSSPVGSFLPNYFGIYDMTGNVQEWCANWCCERLDSLPKFNPQGPDNGWGRIVVGGSWSLGKPYCRIIEENQELADKDSFDIGFRVACSIK